MGSPRYLAGWRRHRFGMSALSDSGRRIHCEEEGVLPAAEPGARPRPRVRRGNEAAGERAGATVKSSDEWRVLKNSDE